MTTFETAASTRVVVHTSGQSVLQTLVDDEVVMETDLKDLGCDPIEMTGTAQVELEELRDDDLEAVLWRLVGIRNRNTELTEAQQVWWTAFGKERDRRLQLDAMTVARNMTEGTIEEVAGWM